MKKLLIVIGLSLSLASCAGLQNFVSKVETGIHNIVTVENIDTLEAVYGSLLAQAVAYYDLCEKKIINKSCWVIIAKAQPYQLKAQKAMLTLRAFVKNNPNADATSLIKLVKSTILAFQNVIPELPTN
jgi:hypothetical protein